MTALRLSFACWNYDRTHALADGTVQPDGIELTFLPLEVEETFFRAARHQEFDACELSLSSYVLSLNRDPAPFIAIPVFPSRMFRHAGIFVSAKSGIRTPKDLAGKRVGVPEWQLTANVWIRGILEDEYQVPVTSPQYFFGGEEEPGREEKLKVDLPPRIKIQPIPAGKTLSRMLADGELDAVHAPRAPSTLTTRPDAVKRLFPDYVAEERAYYRKTKIFPIMHTVAIRREVYEKNRWIAQSLAKAFTAAQAAVYTRLDLAHATTTMLPWQSAHVEETKRELGDRWWPYGFAPNRHVLETFLRYHHAQGLSKRLFKPEELFAPETLESFKI